MENIAGVKAFSWNPRVPLGKGKVLSRIKTPKRVKNFGDLLGPILIRQILASRARPNFSSSRNRTNTKLLNVGSVLHFAQPGDVVWGTGINGKVLPSPEQLQQLDVRAVRGPLTAQKVRDAGTDVPPIFGDPGLLLSELYPQIVEWADSKERAFIAVPNLNDVSSWTKTSSHNILDPTNDFWYCIKSIAKSEVVIASSLHALVIADSLGIPSVPVQSSNEPMFKYIDYYKGTGRDIPEFHDNFVYALSALPQQPVGPITAPGLLEAFPWDLWE